MRDVLIGHTEHNHNYIIFLPETNTIVTTHLASFQEHIFPFRQLKPFDISHLTTANDQPEPLTLPIDQTPAIERPIKCPQPDDPPETPLNPPELPSETPPPPDQVTVRRSERERHPVDYYRPSASPAFWHDDFLFISPNSPCAYAFATSPTVRLLHEPHNYQTAMNSPDVLKWKEACAKEMMNMKEKEVWTLVPRPIGHPVFGGRWHFWIKTHPDGSISRYKARYVAKGYTQTYGVDYTETFAPTGKPSSYRTLVAIAAIHGYDIHQMDAIAAFLNSELDDLIYMEQPEGYVEEGKEDWVCKLNKALYGLKQSARSWNDNFKKRCVEAGFKQSPADECVYVRRRGKDDVCIFYLHVDDLAITGNNIQAFKDEISSFWPMEDLGLAHCVVGIQTSRLGPFHYSISQEAMTNSLLARFGLTNCKSASTPLPGGLKLTRSTNDEARDFTQRDLPY